MRYVALLRGINVGGHNKIPMARLRELLQEFGLEDVATYLQSGNAVFTCSATLGRRVAGAIEAAITRDLGLAVKVLMRSRDELSAVVEADPLRDIATDPTKYFVTFLAGPPEPARLRDIDASNFEPDQFAVGRQEIHLWCPNGLLASKLPAAFSDKRLGVATTTRNWRTLTKLLELADS